MPQTPMLGAGGSCSAAQNRFLFIYFFIIKCPCRGFHGECNWWSIKPASIELCTPVEDCLQASCQMERILCISIRPCKHHHFFPGLLTYSRWRPLRSLYLSSNLWGLLFPKKRECFNILHIFPISMPICESISTE